MYNLFTYFRHDNALSNMIQNLGCCIILVLYIMLHAKLFFLQNSFENRVFSNFKVENCFHLRNNSFEIKVVFRLQEHSDSLSPSLLYGLQAFHLHGWINSIKSTLSSSFCGQLPNCICSSCMLLEHDTDEEQK